MKNPTPDSAATDEMMFRLGLQNARRAADEEAELDRHARQEREHEQLRADYDLLQARVNRALQRLDRTGASVTAAILRGEQ